jgi:hypothetical protein
MYIDDAENYKFVDFEIATGNSTGWSFPTWPSHLDHILITNELFDEYTANDAVVEVIKLESYITGGWSAYDSNISDHRPVALKFKLNKTLNTTDKILQTVQFSNFPNPFTLSTTFSFNTFSENGKIEIFNVIGQRVFSKEITIGENSINWNPTKVPAGMYIAKLHQNNGKLATIKLILNK